MTHWNRWCGIGLMALAAGIPSSAQSLWLPASDPVGIGRSGAGVAFGQSLEAGSLNPALLVTLKERSSAYLGLGVEMAASQVTLQANQRNLYSDDRNRALPAFGGHWRLSDTFALGLKLDNPFLRHARISPESTVRFLGREFDLTTRRLEFQGAWAPRPDLSFGAGLGFARISYTMSTHLRASVPEDPAAAMSPTNPSMALVELEGKQSGSVVSPSFSLGFRWAINPRWTLGGAAQSQIKGSPSLSAERGSFAPVYVANDGFGTAPVGVEAKGNALLARTAVLPGSGSVSLPAKVMLGVRQRFNPFFTWELDVRYVGGSSFGLPSAPSLNTPSGVVGAPALSAGYRSGYGASLMTEIAVIKDWTFRLGASLDPALQDDATVNPVISGSRSFAFSAGASYRVWGGELSAGYQFRQNRDIDGTGLEGAWSSLGYRVTGTTTRVEGMGHLLSIGFKRSF